MIFVYLLSAGVADALWDNPLYDDDIFNTSVSMFTDKTLMIDEFFRYTEITGKNQVILAPLGFSKTTNLKMLKRFVELEVDEFGRKKNKTDTSSYKLFTNKKLKISSHLDTINAHLAEYPVLYFDYSDAMVFSYPRTQKTLCWKLEYVYKPYEYIYEALWPKYCDREDEEGKKFKGKLYKMWKILTKYGRQPDYMQEDCLCVLVEILYEYFQRKVFLFIEYYDRYWFDGVREYRRLWDVYGNERFFNLIFSLYRPEMSQYIEYTFATGTHPIYLHSENFNYNMFLGDHPFVEYYGFTKDEVTKILNPRARAPITELQQLQNFYNGYTTRTKNVQLFQPSSIINYFNQFKPASSVELLHHHHLQKSTYELRPYLLLDPPPLNGQWRALQMPTIREKVEDLVSHGNITFQLRFASDKPLRDQNLFEVLRNEPKKQNMSIEVFFNALFENGYLTYTEIPSYYKIPNESRLDKLKYYLKTASDEFKAAMQDDVKNSWIDYMKKYRLI